MLTFIFLGAGLVVVALVAMFVLRGNSPAGRGQSSTAAARDVQQTRQGVSEPRASGEN